MKFCHRYTGPVAGVIGTMLGAAALSLSAGPAGASTYPDATVDAEGGLLAHRAPSTDAPRTYTFPDGSKLSINCQTKGTRVADDPDWYLVSAEGDAKWISGHYVDLDGKPEHCGPDVSISATTTEATGAYEGPTKHDLYLDSIDKGVGTEVMCYTDSGRPADRHRWMVTLDAQWIPSTSLETAEPVPYCDQR